DLVLDSKVRENEKVYLQEVLQRLAPLAPVRVTSDLLEGPVATAVLHRAVATGTDLIIMTTHGRGPLTRLWLGSVADQLLRQAPVPILLVRPQKGQPDLAWKPKLDRVLIPLDGSDLAETILEPALALGSLVQAHYTLLHVLEPLIVPDRRLG